MSHPKCFFLAQKPDLSKAAVSIQRLLPGGGGGLGKVSMVVPKLSLIKYRKQYDIDIKLYHEAAIEIVLQQCREH